MILSYKPGFKPLILSGSKKHSIRADPHKRWKAGRTIHMATGVRTKNYNCFLVNKCVSTQTIRIKRHVSHSRLNGPLVHCVIVDDRAISMNDTIRLAKNDGFNNIAEFFTFFPDDFSGVIIHWTDLKY